MEKIVTIIINFLRYLVEKNKVEKKSINKKKDVLSPERYTITHTSDKIRAK